MSTPLGSQIAPIPGAGWGPATQARRFGTLIGSGNGRQPCRTYGSPGRAANRKFAPPFAASGLRTAGATDSDASVRSCEGRPWRVGKKIGSTTTAGVVDTTRTPKDPRACKPDHVSTQHASHSGRCSRAPRTAATGCAPQTTSSKADRPAAFVDTTIKQQLGRSQARHPPARAGTARSRWQYRAPSSAAPRRIREHRVAGGRGAPSVRVMKRRPALESSRTIRSTSTLGGRYF